MLNSADYTAVKLLLKIGYSKLAIGRLTIHNLVLQTMSARDNVLIGGHSRSRGGFVANALRLPAVGCEERLLSKRASGLLQMLQLASVADLPVSVLPFWSRKRVELARALASEPKLLLLDEPAAGIRRRAADAGDLARSDAAAQAPFTGRASFGLAPLVVQEIFRILRTINSSQGVSMLLVEQNAHIALELADYAYLIETGCIVMGGPAAIIARVDATRRAYLG